MKYPRTVRPQQRPRGTGPLAEIRLKSGLSRSQVAKELGVTSGLIGLLEAGRSGTRVEVIVALAKLYRVREQAIIDALQKCRATFARRKVAAA